MNKDDIIRMARKVWGEQAILPFDDLERFATLVAAAKETELMDGMTIAYMSGFAEGKDAGIDAERERGQKWFDATTAQHKAEMLAEREACAKVCESEWSNVAERMYGEECAAAIRARGQA